MKSKMFHSLFVIFIIFLLTACSSGEESSTEPETTTKQPTTEMEEWETELYDLAKEEGAVNIIGWPSSDRETLLAEFEKKYPGVKVNYIGMRYSDAMVKLKEEQNNGKFLADIQLEGLSAQFEDINQYIVNPDVQKDENWYGGFATGVDSLIGTSYEGQYIYGIQALPQVLINNDVIPEGEIKTFEDLLKSEYSDKVLTYDFSLKGQGAVTLTALAREKGEQYITDLVKTVKPVMASDHRQIVQWFATGKYPIVIGIDTTQISEFTEKGIIKKVQKLRLDKTSLYNPFGIAVLKNPPNPNASKLFVNWFLSKDGQEKYVEILDVYQSRRTDASEVKNEYAIPWAQIDAEKAIPILTEEPQKLEAWVMEQGKIYKGEK